MYDFYGLRVKINCMSCYVYLCRKFLKNIVVVMINKLLLFVFILLLSEIDRF